MVARDGRIVHRSPSLAHRTSFAAGERLAASTASAPVTVRIPRLPLLSPLPFLSTKIFQVLPDLEGIRGVDGDLCQETLGDKKILINQSWEEEEGYWCRLLVRLSTPPQGK